MLLEPVMPLPHSMLSWEVGVVTRPSSVSRKQSTTDTVSQKHTHIEFTKNNTTNCTTSKKSKEWRFMVQLELPVKHVSVIIIHFEVMGLKLQQNTMHETQTDTDTHVHSHHQRPNDSRNFSIAVARVLNKGVNTRGLFSHSVSRSWARSAFIYVIKTSSGIPVFYCYDC